MAFTAEKCCSIPAHTACCSTFTFHQPSELSSECVVHNSTPDLRVTSALNWSSSIAVSVLTLSLAERSVTALIRIFVSCIHLSLSFPPSPHAALKSPAAFHEQRRSLERARVSVLSTESFLLSWRTCCVVASWGKTFTVYIYINSSNHGALFEIELYCQYRYLCWKLRCYIIMSCTNKQVAQNYQHVFNNWSSRLPLTGNLSLQLPSSKVA